MGKCHKKKYCLNYKESAYNCNYSQKEVLTCFKPNKKDRFVGWMANPYFEGEDENQIRK